MNLNLNRLWSLKTLVFCGFKRYDWLVVSTHLKNISQIGNLPQIGVKTKKKLKPPPRRAVVCVSDFCLIMDLLAPDVVGLAFQADLQENLLLRRNNLKSEIAHGTDL